MAFNDAAFEKWFPYQSNQSLVFKAQNTTDTVHFLLSYVNMSEAYEATQGGYNNNFNGCQSSVSIQGIDIPARTRFLNIFYQKMENATQTATISNLELRLNGAAWSAGTIKNTGIDFTTSYSWPTKIDSSYNLLFANGIVYPVVFIFTSDTINNKNNQPYKIYIAKNAGIIGYDEFPSNKKWVIQ